ncbi:DUF6093 family protein [Aeromicrobium endophyticum]|uniref:Uncharacterized protein n=1 Tax=Aeromicrobium endophyticum TaxID=2292704 RepID=A0A371PCL1_9ACTN|nr:DUF6093 family protein [Aeromicrobium endophyticum]REK73647.1 hypothetical protein DX116_08965 [Aeromicrobium endophyticum]
MTSPYESGLRALRREAERAMIDSCKVSRIRRDDAGQPVTTTDADGIVAEVRDDIYGPGIEPHRGKAKRQADQVQEQTPEAGGNTFTIQRYRVDFPAESFRPAVGDLVEWVACPLDAGRVGTRDRITGPFGKTFATALRVSVEEGA